MKTMMIVAMLALSVTAHADVVEMPIPMRVIGLEHAIAADSGSDLLLMTREMIQYFEAVDPIPLHTLDPRYNPGMPGEVGVFDLRARFTPDEHSFLIGVNAFRLMQGNGTAGGTGGGGVEGKGFFRRAIDELHPMKHPKIWIGAITSAVFVVGEREDWWDVVDWSFVERSRSRDTLNDQLAIRNADGTVVPGLLIFNAATGTIDYDGPLDHANITIVNAGKLDLQIEEFEACSAESLEAGLCLTP